VICAKGDVLHRSGTQGPAHKRSRKSGPDILRKPICPMNFICQLYTEKDVLGSSPESQVRSRHYPRRRQSRAWRNTDKRPAIARLGLHLWDLEMLLVLGRRGSYRGWWDGNRQAKISFELPSGKIDAEECRTLLAWRHPTY